MNWNGLNFRKKVILNYKNYHSSLLPAAEKCIEETLHEMCKKKQAFLVQKHSF